MTDLSLSSRSFQLSNAEIQFVKKKPITCAAPVSQSQVDRTGTGPKERNENASLCLNAVMKEQEFKFLALSPENGSLRGPTGRVWKEVRHHLHGYAINLFSEKY